MSQPEIIKNKVHNPDSLKKLLRVWRMKNQKVVFTNGCFDILHPGHVEYLGKAKDRGNRLVIGINTDASLKKLGKGDDRPIQNEESRAFIIASLGFVDAVILFDDETPYELIKNIVPDVLIKGGDYDPEKKDKNDPAYIVGSDIVRENGGEVDVIPFKEGYSTTSIINKIKGK